MGRRRHCSCEDYEFGLIIVIDLVVPTLSKTSAQHIPIMCMYSPIATISTIMYSCMLPVIDSRVNKYDARSHFNCVRRPILYLELYAIIQTLSSLLSIASNHVR